MNLKKDDQHDQKRPYEPPRIVAREKLEALAGPCVKQGGNANCALGPIAS